MTILNESHFPDWNINEFRMMRGDTVSLSFLISVILMMIIVISSENWVSNYVKEGMRE